MDIARAVERSSLATLLGLLSNYASFYALGSPLWTETISEWIMAHTPSPYAVAILQGLGACAKPFAMTGALATLGLVVFAIWPLRWAGPPLAAVLLGWAFGYQSWIGQFSFWIPVAVLQLWPMPPRNLHAGRRELLTSGVMTLGAAAVALESFLRNAALAREAGEPVPLFPFQPPPERFFPALVRKAVTPVSQFYGMSKNTVDPAIDTRTWRLRITSNGKPVREFTYEELLSLPRVDRYVTLRCVSNTLKSDLMGTAAWSGIHLRQLIDPASLPGDLVEIAIIGSDGHGDSLRPEYAFSDEVLFALGMNGRSLDRTHGFPLRLLAPRYYGFKNVKWIQEIALLNQLYFGTWPKMGYTKEPVIHIASHIDRVEHGPEGLRVGGVSFAGTRGVNAVEVRAGAGPWMPAILEQPLSPYTWTRWYILLPVTRASSIEARARDGEGRWQESVESPLFPDGVRGPTIRRLG